MRVKKILRFLLLFCLVLSVCLVTACNRNNNGDMTDDDLNDTPDINGSNNNDNNTNNGDDPLNPADPDNNMTDPLNPIDPMIPDNGNTDNNATGDMNGNTVVPDNNLSTATPEINSVFEAVSNAYGEDFYADSERDEAFLTEKVGVNMDDVESFFVIRLRIPLTPISLSE